MAITSFTAPATTDTDTIVARMVSDGSLVGVSHSDFSLHRSDTDAELPATIRQSKQGNHFWDVTAQLTGSYFGEAYFQIRANAFRDVATLAFLPRNPLRSNTFAFVALAPTNFAVSDGVTTAVLTWDMLTGLTYELRRDGGTWQTVTSPHTITGLLPDTEYLYEVRVTTLRGSVSNGIASITKRTLLYPIEDIDEQFIPINTENYEFIIGLIGQHSDSRVLGLQEGFYQTFKRLDNGNSQIIIKSIKVTRLIEDAIWNIVVGDTGWSVEQDVIYNVVPVAPIFVDPGAVTMWKGVPFQLLVQVLNNPSVQRGESELVGLKFEAVTIDEKNYIQSDGLLPLDADLTFDSFKSKYYIENPGGSDSLEVTVTIRDDAVAPVISGLRTGYRIRDGSAVNLPFSVRSIPTAVVTLREGSPGWLTVEHVSESNYRLVGTASGTGTFRITIIATGLGEVTFSFQIQVV